MNAHPATPARSSVPTYTVPAEPAPELLAPAGDWESLRAAVGAGADAVYFGLSNFNARHRATNFSLEELPQVIDFLHQRNVRGYVTCNTLIFSDELDEIAQLIAAIDRAGADAVIVQDLGLARLIARLAPSLAVHGSTQMTLTEPRGIEMVRRLGVLRVILARELSLENIADVRAATPVPVEVFVHGALCVAYSGQCLTSEALGGRSANRGQCAQACRLPYELLVDGVRRDLGDVAYLLSPQDLASHELIPELRRLGVSSLKIEGRLKSASYVAITTQTYRQAIDAAVSGTEFALARQQQLDLQQSFSRGFSPGFLAGIDHQSLVPGRFPKSRGVRLGTFVGLTKRGVRLRLDPQHTADILRPGDGVVFDQGRPDSDEQGGRLYEVHLLSATAPQTTASAQPTSNPVPLEIELVFARDALHTEQLTEGCLLWKTNDATLRRRMEQLYSRDRPPRRAALDVHLRGRAGEALVAEVRDQQGIQATATWAGPLEVARGRPLDEPTLREQFGRLGDTPFELRSATFDFDAPLMVPKSVLNQLRREAIERLLALRASNPHAIHPEALGTLRSEAATTSRPSEPTLPTTPQLLVLVRTLEQLAGVLEWRGRAETIRPAMVYCDFEDVRRYREAVPLARQGQLPIALATLRVIKPGEEGLLRHLLQAEPDAVLVRNLGSIDFFKEHAPRLPQLGDYALNVANELTADWLRRHGLRRLTPSYDLSYDQLAAMLRRIDPGLFEVVVHQHMPMFHMEHCVFAHTLSEGKDWRDCGRPCDHHRVELRDRAGAEFPLLADTGCRNTVFNSVPQSAAEYLPRMLGMGLRHFRVELLRESAAEVAPLLDHYAALLSGRESARNVWRGLQVLNQLGVTRGTLQHG